MKAIYRFAEANQVPVVHFKKGEKKEETARPYLEAAAREGKARVVLIGVAQEKASIWKSWPRKGQEKARHPHMDWDREMAYINHFYFYLWDSEWGAAFWKTNAYAPWPIWLWLNGHEWAKRQLEKVGIAYAALDNGFRSCSDAAALQKICDRLGPGAVQSFFGRWWRRLPSPFTDADVRAGYGYQMSSRQFEVADTCVFDRPPAGRMWFEGVIRDHLDIGRPDQIALIFHRRVSSRTPGTFRTRVISRGVDPTLCCYYKSSRVKQYFKEGRALRTETVICNPDDFGIGRRVCAQNWNALRAVGESANRCLCDAEAADAQPAPDVATFCQVTRPSTTDDGLYAPALRFGEPRVMSILAALVGFCFLIRGFTNRQLVERVRGLLQSPYTSRQATYDLRRLRRKGIIVKISGTQRYQLASLGRRVAVLFTKTYGRVLAPGLSMLDPRLPDDVAARNRLSTTWHGFEGALDEFIQENLVAART
ncbi:MAG TPA: hypothetical protein VFL31_03690 [Nitrospiraceae bacterium]|nr:hypothetical protein [Nitrospiraceae bacterium]